MKRALLLTALTLSLVGCSDELAREDPALIVLVSLDTLRAGHVSAYGYERPTTPNLDALAAEGILFERVVAQATNTLISHKSMMTGKQPLRLISEEANATAEQIRDYPDPGKLVQGTLGAVKPTLAASLKADGYRTAGFADGSWMMAQFNFGLGFDLYESQDKVGLKVNGPRALDWIGKLGDKRGFVFLHTYDIHCPYTPPEPFASLFCKDHASHVDFAHRCAKQTSETIPGFEQLGLDAGELQAIRDHYDGGIVYTDDLLGDFFDGLRAADRYDEALIIVTSDHGEGLGAEGQIGHGGLFPDQVLVPLVVKFPTSWKMEPRRVSDIVELTDLVPTLLEATGQTVTEGLDGRSLIPAASGERFHRVGMAQVAYNEFQGESVWQTNPSKRAVFDPDGWWLVYDEKADERILLQLDGLDSTGRTENGEIVKELETTMRVREHHGAKGAFKMPELGGMSPEAQRQLRSLGYLGDDNSQ